MIVYDLVCRQGHGFEGWFDSARDYETQYRSGALECPVCGTGEVHKIPTASRLNLKKGGVEVEREEGRRRALLEKYYRQIERDYEDVGERFAEEARKIHYGESERRNIRGVASWAEYRALRQEGIGAAPTPFRPRSRDKLN